MSFSCSHSFHMHYIINKFYDDDENDMNYSKRSRGSENKWTWLVFLCIY